MEKNRFLVSPHRAFVAVLLAFLLCSCSLPRLVILRDPLTPEEHINLGVSYEKNGELDAALKEYEVAARNLPIAYLYVGNVYFQKKIYEEADNNYRIAIRKTGDPKAYNNLAWLYYVQGIKLDDAERLARRALELSPDSDEFRDTLSQILEKRKSTPPQGN